MKRLSKTNRTLQILAIATMLALYGPNWVLAQESEPVEKEASPSRMEGGPGACGCRARAAGEYEPGQACGARRAGEGGRGMHRRGAGRGMGRGVGQGMGSGPSGSGGRHGGHQGAMQAIRALVHEYRGDIVREIEDVPNGVVTVTRSPENPVAVEVLQKHVAEMKGILESGGRMRAWDPLFREIFDHSDEIEMVIETLDDGVRVTETSQNPEVVKLIRAHARKVNEFVARGPAAVHEPTSLPDDYGDTE